MNGLLYFAKKYKKQRKMSENPALFRVFGQILAEKVGFEPTRGF